MDNITHTLVGALTGMALASKEKDSKLKRYIIGTSILANNFPDFDLLYSVFISEPFGYLLHHRGHTHTFIGALISGLLIWLIALTFWRISGRTIRRKASIQLLITAVLGGITHLVFDWMNSYGVHPFWPVSNKWIYGDTLFIIEPFLWISLGAAVYYGTTKRFFRFLSLIPVFGVILLIIFSGALPRQIIFLDLLILLIIFLLTSRLSAVGKKAIWLAVTVIVLVIFYFSGQLASRRLQESRADQQAILTSFVQPSPANPFCWQSWQIKVDQDNFIYELGLVYPYGNFLSLDCSKGMLSSNSNNPRIINSYFTVLGQQVISRKVINQLSENCRWKAFLQFARLPAVVDCEEEQQCSVDLRFSKGNANNFSAHKLEGECPTLLPPWETPVHLPKR